MIKYGLKLWSNNENLFQEAARLCKAKAADFIEFYHNPLKPLRYEALALLKGYVATIHNTDDYGFEKFVVGKKELMIWKHTLKLADFFKSRRIVVHPGRLHTFATFKVNLSKIDDPRILIENMAGLDVNKKKTYARTLAQLKKIKALRDICFDLEKAVKAAAYQKKDYKAFIAACLKELQPSYFHISGGKKDTSVDEHCNLWDSDIDFVWVKRELESFARGKIVSLVFEVPKIGNNLENDLKNITYFKSLS